VYASRRARLQTQMCLQRFAHAGIFANGDVITPDPNITRLLALYPLQANARPRIRAGNYDLFSRMCKRGRKFYT
jgi:hypothetical protein